MNRLNFLYPSKTRELAGGRVQSATPNGKRRAQGDITFTVQPTVGETVTINGTVFTFIVNGGTPVGNQIALGTTLTLTLDAMVVALNASAVAAVAKATYSKSGTTILRIVHDAYGTVGNAFTVAEGSAVASVASATLLGGQDADAVNLDAETKALVTFTGAAVADPMEWDLPVGEEGQITTFYLKTKAAGIDAKVNGAFVGGTAITFDTAGEYFTAKFLNASWVVQHNTGALT